MSALLKRERKRETKKGDSLVPLLYILILLSDSDRYRQPYFVMFLFIG
jgi:hypothetical protein